MYAKTGNELLEWQQLLQCDIMAVNEDGLWGHQKYGYSVSRRNGKSKNVLARCLWALTHGESVRYTAHRATTSHVNQKLLGIPELDQSMQYGRERFG